MADTVQLLTLEGAVTTALRTFVTWVPTIETSMDAKASAFVLTSLYTEIQTCAPFTPNIRVVLQNSLNFCLLVT